MYICEWWLFKYEFCRYYSCEYHVHTKSTLRMKDNYKFEKSVFKIQTCFLKDLGVIFGDAIID